MRRAQRFQIAAATYFLYGTIYLSGALYLVRQGIGVRGQEGAPAALAWFILGGVFLILFPWLISKGGQGRGYLWFTRILTLLVAYRALQLARLAWQPAATQVALPWGGEISLWAGSWIFCLLTVATALVLAWASWRPGEKKGSFPE